MRRRIDLEDLAARPNPDRVVACRDRVGTCEIVRGDLRPRRARRRTARRSGRCCCRFRSPPRLRPCLDEIASPARPSPIVWTTRSSFGSTCETVPSPAFAVQTDLVPTATPRGVAPTGITSTTRFRCGSMTASEFFVARIGLLLSARGAHDADDRAAARISAPSSTSRPTRRFDSPERWSRPHRRDGGGSARARILLEDLPLQLLRVAVRARGRALR